MKMGELLATGVVAEAAEGPLSELESSARS